MSGKNCPQEQLKSWFFSCRRLLPWRENPSPYAVWVSEVMLQQTQVSVVIPYFQRWMDRFPSISALAAAPLESVIKLWEGLGYYSRARHLHEGARYLTEHHGGKLPSDPAALKKVKGLGPYTVGAILSFAFKEKAAAVDGNVLRTLARYYAIEEEVDKPFTRKLIEQKVLEFLPDLEPWVAMEALIELGALVCQKTPKCEACPLAATCLAKQQNKEKELPRKGKKIPTTKLHRLVTIIESDGAVLVKKGEKGKVMADLWEFPYVEISKKETEEKVLHALAESLFNLPLNYHQPLPEVAHGFTRYRAFLYPHHWHSEEQFPVSSYGWVLRKELKNLPFSSGHRKILAFLEN